MSYNKDWNSRENRRRRIEAEYEQALRDLDRYWVDVSELLFKPLGWAAGVFGIGSACAVGVWLVARWVNG